MPLTLGWHHPIRVDRPFLFLVISCIVLSVSFLLRQMLSLSSSSTAIPRSHTSTRSFFSSFFSENPVFFSCLYMCRVEREMPMCCSRLLPSLSGPRYVVRCRWSNFLFVFSRFLNLRVYEQNTRGSWPWGDLCVCYTRPIGTHFCLMPIQRTKTYFYRFRPHRPGDHEGRIGARAYAAYGLLDQLASILACQDITRHQLLQMQLDTTN